MTDDITVAFESLEARAIATQSEDPLDRISVRDYIRNIEIGAFQSERDTRQRVRFNIVLEVAPTDAADLDDVDQILSYDTITDAIEQQLQAARLNLLETLAERIAETILKHPRTVRIFVRIEKLDRIPGSLAVDIVRSSEISKQAENASDTLKPLVIFMPNTVLYGPDLAAWLKAICKHERPAIICLEPLPDGFPGTGIAKIDQQIGLLSVGQNAWVLASKDHRCVVVDNRTELDWALKNNQLSVWAPAKIVLDAVDKPVTGPSRPLQLAQWFAKEFFADQIYVLQDYKDAANSSRLSLVATPNAL